MRSLLPVHDWKFRRTYEVLTDLEIMAASLQITIIIIIIMFCFLLLLSLLSTIVYLLHQFNLLSRDKNHADRYAPIHDRADRTPPTTMFDSFLLQLTVAQITAPPLLLQIFLWTACQRRLLIPALPTILYRDPTTVALILAPRTVYAFALLTSESSSPRGRINALQRITSCDARLS